MIDFRSSRIGKNIFLNESLTAVFNVFLTAPVSGHPHTSVAAMAEWASRLILHDA